jgi:4-amino-4-deoxy-L-arabinose transferase-like glycosyltransferase
MKEKKKRQQKSDPYVNQTSGFLFRLRNFALTYDFLILFVLIYIVYNTVTRMSWSGDVVPAEFLPISLIVNQTLFFDSVLSMAEIGPNLAYAFPLVNGHYVSLFPIVTPVLVTPIYFISCVPLIIFGIPLNLTLITIMAKTSATIVAALSCVFVYLTVKELFSKKTALITVLVYAFATSTWSVSSQALWQHGTVELLLILMIWLIIRNEQEPSRKKIIVLGLLSGLFLFNRPPDAVLLLPVIGYVIWYERKNLPVYAISAAATALPFLVYNFSIFGNVFGGYKQNLVLFSFSIDSIRNFAGLLVAPNVGLLIFSPVLVLSVYGYLKLSSVPSERIRRVLVVFGPVILLEILVYSFFAGWDSSVAYSYGQRFLTGLVPVLAIYVGIVMNEFFVAEPEKPGARAIRAVIVLLVVVSVIIQAIGVFLYPLYPDRSTNSERTWDWDHSIIFESYRYGISRIDSVTTYSFPPLPDLFHYEFGPPAT